MLLLCTDHVTLHHTACCRRPPAVAAVVHPLSPPSSTRCRRELCRPRVLLRFRSEPSDGPFNTSEAEVYILLMY